MTRGINTYLVFVSFGIVAGVGVGVGNKEQILIR